MSIIFLLQNSNLAVDKCYDIAYNSYVEARKEVTK